MSFARGENPIDLSARENIRCEAVWYGGLLACLLLLAGCTTAKHIPASAPPAPLPAATPARASDKSPQPPFVAEQPARITFQPLPAAEQPHARETPASSLKKLLPKTLVAMEVSPTTLLVKPATPTGSPSLFEEAIALSKLRGILSANPAIPKNTSQKTRIQNGTATIPFGKSVQPADASTALVSALSVSGVQRVRAVLNAY